MNTDVKVIERTTFWNRCMDYFELMKPELTILSVLTTLCGFYLATTGPLQYWLLLHVATGTLLVGGGAGALNQFIERNYDRMMKRTERRPLPAGRLVPVEVLVFGIVISILGILELTFFANPLTGLLAALTWTTYLFLYTPLKRITPYATIIGGIPGAIPPMMGWTSVRNELSIEAWILFAILFCWQMPHFFSLAWMYRKDYSRAGFKILTVTDHSGRRTSRWILAYSIALLPASIGPAIVGMTGILSSFGAVILGLAFLYVGCLLSKYSGSTSEDSIQRINHYSRQMFFASLIYLPLLMLFMTIDKL